MKTDELSVDGWYYSEDHRQVCRVVESQGLWGAHVCRVWLPREEQVVRLPAERLRPVSEAPTGTVTGLRYAAAAARVADVLAQHDVLLAPIESSVIPLPHQIRALSRAISDNRVRYLLADEVGLGKTIEAGLIVRELKLRGLVNRVLVIAPKGLVTQWVAEMETHFGEEFRLLIPSDFSAYRRITQQDNIWRAWPQVVCPMDSVKPMDARRGWSHHQVDDYNRERFHDLISAGWDMVIVDEAHRLGGSTEQVARYRLGQGLAEAAPYLLLLSATPHQGKTDAFHRLISLVDGDAFPDVGSVTRDRVEPYVIRTEKRHAIDAEGKPLFLPRRTELAPVRWEERHHEQRSLYEAVTEYVRIGYNQAMREKRSYIGFLMILMQRLVVSSTSAIATSLERRLTVLQAPQEQLTLFPMDPSEWADLDGQEQIDTLLRARLTSLKNERAEVELLLKASRECEQVGPDAKAEALLDWIYRLQAEEGDPELKVLMFTEFVPTQAMLASFLADRGISVTCLNGSMGMDERRQVQEAFAGDARILISTDAGGEGLNLQFCHTVVNYDIPWNPMRLEQRIGRVDRIGQRHIVRAINFMFEDSVEFRVRDVLEEKLAVIFDEFGIDKTGDVLDSGEAEHLFDDLYVDAILNPDAVEATVSTAVEKIRQHAHDAREGTSILGSPESPEPGAAQRLMAHPLPHWVECMTISYLRSHGGVAERDGKTWTLTWPDGDAWPGVVFTNREAESSASARLLTLEEPRIRGLSTRLFHFAPGQPIACVAFDALPPEVTGWWALWSIAIYTGSRAERRILPIFLHDDGRSLPPSARHVWDQFLNAVPDVTGFISGGQASERLKVLEHSAQEAGQPLFEDLLQAHRSVIERERAKGEYSFKARRAAIERIGLYAVRAHRLKALDEERQAWQASLDARSTVLPELQPLTVVRIQPGGVRV
ncbi:MAG: DEAD/DEAH box helicase [bacterium]